MTVCELADGRSCSCISPLCGCQCVKILLAHACAHKYAAAPAGAGSGLEPPALPVCQAWDLAVVLHLLANTSAEAEGEDEGAASPSSVLQGDVQQPFGAQYIPQLSADRTAACGNATVLVRASKAAVASGPHHALHACGVAQGPLSCRCLST